MSHIEIDKKPLIFDDPELCQHSDFKNKRCLRLFRSAGVCGVFENKDGYPIPLKKMYALYRKCDECKTAWKAAKEKPVWNIENGEIIGGAIFHHDGSITQLGDNPPKLTEEEIYITKGEDQSRSRKRWGEDMEMKNEPEKAPKLNWAIGLNKNGEVIHTFSATETVIEQNQELPEGGYPDAQTTHDYARMTGYGKGD